MASDESNTPPNDKQKNQWKLYELLCGTLPYYHNRWVDNYRIFLSFNAFLMPAVIALLMFSFKENSEILLPFVSLLCGISSWITYQEIGLLKRISIDADLRLNQLTRLEDEMVDMSVKSFQEGRDLFIHNQDVEGFPQYQHRDKDRNDKGRKAIDVYISNIRAIIVFYLIVGVIAPLFWFF